MIRGVRRMGKERPDAPACSQNAHNRNVLARANGAYREIDCESIVPIPEEITSKLGRMLETEDKASNLAIRHWELEPTQNHPSDFSAHYLFPSFVGRGKGGRSSGRPPWLCSASMSSRDQPRLYPHLASPYKGEEQDEAR